jgi:sporulation protein YlmC with PRC-barrel domain
VLIKIDPAAAVHASYRSAGHAKMKTILFDSLDEAGARKLTGCKVIDESGEAVGTVDGLWMDSSSHRVEFVGVKNSSFSGKVRVIHARDAQIIEEGCLLKIRYPAALIKQAPSFFFRSRTCADAKMRK